MHRYPARRNLDLSMFERPVAELPVYYGLPRDVQFCRKCVISNQRPNSAVEFKHTRESIKPTIRFNEDGVCDACRVNELKSTSINWDDREHELRELCDRHRRSDGKYDCLVPGSGGKDSFFAAHILKTKFGMHPLTVTWAPHIYTEWGWQNFQKWIHNGFDNYLCTPDGRVHRLLTRLAVENLFHPFQPFMIGQKAMAPRLAMLFDIPLVFYGENEAEYGNPLSDTAVAQRNHEYHSLPDSEVFLGGTSIEDLKSEFGVDSVALQPYLPADPEALQSKGTQVHYLGYYLKWHPQSAYYYAVEHGGFEASPERTPGTYSKYNSIDDRMDDFHYYTTFVKFGIGRATYDAAQEVRNDDITREEGVALVRRFDGEFPERFADEIFRYLSLPASDFPQASTQFEQPMMDRAYFDSLADSFRSPHLWAREHGKWVLRHRVFDDSPLSPDYLSR
ncbi:MAG: N-acetyl sugar amidotransferase [Fimbriimonadaceae bacterium]|nr:N-acetyl sugar amidotransferase [Fimbriimonadaceae bacterium]